MVFPLFTNGTLIDDAAMDVFRRNRQIIPVISLEGSKSETDRRRGVGTFELIRTALDRMDREDLLFGVSITLTSNNFSLLSDDAFINDLVDAGCRIIFCVEFVPLEEGTDDECLTAKQQRTIATALEALRKKYTALFIALPGEEEQYGGCLAAGRGFIHISAAGDVEPCPFAPYSDINLNDVSLEKGLRSVFLSNVRSNHPLLTESKGGCALWENREWVSSILERSRETELE